MGGPSMYLRTANTQERLLFFSDAGRSQVMFLFVILAVSCLSVFFFILPAILQRRRRNRQMRSARARAMTAQTIVPSEKRCADIETWLISKPVQAHDDLCDHALRHQKPKQSVEEMALEECTICFEKFQANDIVSFSPNPNCCGKVFHHGCYKEWLLQNTGCPWCRKTVLPMDSGFCDSTKNTSKQQIQNLLIAQQKRSESSYYCVTHGLVKVTLRRSTENLSILEQMDDKCRLCTRSELEVIRGDDFGDAPSSEMVVEMALCSSRDDDDEVFTEPFNDEEQLVDEEGVFDREGSVVEP